MIGFQWKILHSNKFVYDKTGVGVRDKDGINIEREIVETHA
jgi:hypothetical protein